MTAGEMLKAWRGERSQADVAAELGINQSTLARLELGQTEPRLDLAVRIAEASDGSVPLSAWTTKKRKARKSA